MATEKERVEIELTLKAKDALARLDELKKRASETKKSLEEMGKVSISDFGSGSSSSGLPKFSEDISSARNRVDAMKRSLLDMRKSSGESLEFVADIMQNRFKTQLDNVSGGLVDTSKAQKQFNNDLSQAKREINNAEKATKGFAGGVNALKIALGAIVSMVIFRGIQAIEETFREASERAKELEVSMFRLANAERILSEGGQEVSLSGLQQGIQEVKDLLPIFSTDDITKQVSLIGIMTKDLGLSEKQIIDLAKSIAVMNVNSAASEDLLSTTNRVLSSIVSKGVGIGDLGLSFKEPAIRAKALEMGFIDVGQSLSDLDDEQRLFVEGQVKVALAIETTEAQMSNLNDIMETNYGKIEENKSAWNEYITTLGAVKNTLTPALSDSFEYLQKLSERGIISSLIGTSDDLSNWEKFSLQFKLSFANLPLAREEIEAIQTALSSMSTVDLQKLFPDPAAIKNDAVRDIITGLLKSQDTPTTQPEIQQPEPIDVSGLGFQDLIDDLEELSRKSAEAKAEFDQDWAGGANVDVNVKINSSAFNQLGREVQDYVIDVQRTLEDYAVKEADIRSSANKKIADIQAKARQDQINEEAKFQEQLRQLREKYLFSLEDALRDRDARQVLRLKRQYEMDKTALENENALRQKERNADTQAAIAAAVAERDERLRLLDEERNLKLQRMEEDFNLKRQREEEDHTLEMEDIKRRIDERLEEFAVKSAEELELREEAAEAIYDTLKKYFGDQGLIDKLYDQSIQSGAEAARELATQVQQALASLQALQQMRSVLGQFPVSPYSTAAYTGANLTEAYSGQSYLEPIYSIGGQANGGLYYANKPTHALFGEAGGEFASFIPENQLRSMMNGKGNTSQSKADGNLNLQVTLSPDLEARIVNNSLQKVTATIDQVRRSGK